MGAFRSILVDTDPTADAQPAFQQACDLAARLGAHVTAVAVSEDASSRARTALATLARTRPDVPIDTAVLRGRPAIALVQQVRRGNHDLVVRAHARDLVPGTHDRAVDMHLLRTCPCPVWLVGPERVAQPPHVLTAVDTEANVPGAAELNQTILETALTLGEAWHARVTVVHAWSLFGEELLRNHSAEGEMHEWLRASERQACDGLAAFVATLGDRADGVRTECIKGDPRHVIPRFVTDHHVDVVVMGTVARRGIAGFLMGNTAETVVRELRGSVFAVKPPRFVSRVAAPDHAGHAATA